MAIYTNRGRRIVSETVTVDKECYVGSELIKVRAHVDYDLSAKYYFISDLRGDRPNEVRDVINAAVKAPKRGTR